MREIQIPLWFVSKWVVVKYLYRDFVLKPELEDWFRANGFKYKSRIGFYGNYPRILHRSI